MAQSRVLDPGDRVSVLPSLGSPVSFADSHQHDRPVVGAFGPWRSGLCLSSKRVRFSLYVLVLAGNRDLLPENRTNWKQDLSGLAPCFRNRLYLHSEPLDRDHWRRHGDEYFVHKAQYSTPAIPQPDFLFFLSAPRHDRGDSHHPGHAGDGKSVSAHHLSPGHLRLIHSGILGVVPVGGITCPTLVVEHPLLFG